MEKTVVNNMEDWECMCCEAEFKIDSDDIIYCPFCGSDNSELNLIEKPATE